MKVLRLRTIIFISVTLFVISCILFLWQLWGNLSANKPIDSGIFSDFGSFISGIFGFINFILLLYVFKESKEQSYDTFFFNHLQIHDSVTRDLKSKIGDILILNNDAKELFNNSLCENLTANDLKNQCISYRNMPDSTDYFETLYRILHIRYKYRNDTLKMFFDAYSWRIGHFLRSFISVVELIDEAIVDSKKKNSYIRVLQSRSSSDEVRLLFYYIISTGNKQIALLFNSFDFFSIITDPLIKPDDRTLYTTLLRS